MEKRGKKSFDCGALYIIYVLFRSSLLLQYNLNIKPPVLVPADFLIAYWQLNNLLLQMFFIKWP